MDKEKELSIDARNLYLSFYDLQFEQFKLDINTIFASFKNKNYLSFGYEQAYEDKKNNFERYLDSLTDGLIFDDAQKLYDIYYSDSVEEAYCYIENYNMNTDQFIEVILNKNDAVVTELEKLIYRIDNDKSRFSNISDTDKVTLKSAIRKYINRMLDFSHSINILMSDFISDIEEIKFVD